MGNPVVHFELNGPDGQALAAFYSQLFGWHVQEVPGAGYWVIDTHAGTGINGGIGQTSDGGAYGTFYVESDQPEALLEQAEKAGAKVIVPITETPMVTYGQFADPDGNIVGIVKAAEGEAPGVSSGSNPPVDWFEVLGTDAERTQRFYRDAFGWNIADSDFAGYRLVEHEHDDEGRDVTIGGGIGAGDGPTWATVYAKVPAVEASLQRAEELGGKRLYGPNEPMPDMKAGAFTDPAGNAFGVYQGQ